MLIFLDIDGVMVPAKSWKRPEILKDGFPDFSISSVSALNLILSKSVALILTTSHKSSYSINKWKLIFKNRGIELTHIVSLEENSTGLSRKDELLRWFIKNIVSEPFVIIDDDKSLNGLPNYLKRHLLLTSPIIGLNMDSIPEINRILNMDFELV
jgi:hypothetical protein